VAERRSATAVEGPREVGAALAMGNSLGMWDRVYDRSFRTREMQAALMPCGEKGQLGLWMLRHWPMSCQWYLKRRLKYAYYQIPTETLRFFELPDVTLFDNHVPCGCLAFCTYIHAMYKTNFSSATRTFN